MYFFFSRFPHLNCFDSFSIFPFLCFLYRLFLIQHFWGVGMGTVLQCCRYKVTKGTHCWGLKGVRSLVTKSCRTGAKKLKTGWSRVECYEFEICVQLQEGIFSSLFWIPRHGAQTDFHPGLEKIPSFKIRILQFSAWNTFLKVTVRFVFICLS